MTLTYRPAYEVEDVARPIMAEHHARLEAVEVRYVFRSEPAKRRGRVLIGEPKKVTGLASYFAHAAVVDYPVPSDSDDDNAPPFFTIVASESLWAIMEAPQRKACTDHWLSQCAVEHSENGLRLSVVDPEAGEFPAVVERHGLYLKALRDLVGAAYKLHPTLFDPDEVGKLTIVVGSTHATAEVTVTVNHGKWEARCTACGTVHTDDVMVVAEEAAAEHQAWHATQAAAESGDDEGDDSFGEDFDAKVAALTGDAG